MPEYSWRDFEKPGAREPAALTRCRLWLLAGEEEWLRRQFQETLLDGLLSVEERAWGLEVFRLSSALARGKAAAQAQVEAILRSVAALPFFSPRRVVVVEEVQFLPADQQKELAASLQGLPETASLILASSEKAGAKKGRLSAALCEAVKKTGNLVRFDSLNARDAIAWIQEEARRTGKRLEPSAAALLVQQRVGSDLGRLKMEVDKLALFAGSSSAITAAHVEEMTPRLVEEKVWDLTDALARGKAGQGRALAVLRGILRPGEEPSKAKGEALRLLGALSRHFRLLWQTKGLMEDGWRPGQPVGDFAEGLLLSGRNSVQQVFTAHSWQSAKLAEQAGRLTWPQLENAFLALAECDLALKALSSPPRTDPGLALELTVIALAG